jgi:hypothetical protein
MQRLAGVQGTGAGVFDFMPSLAKVNGKGQGGAGSPTLTRPEEK